MITSLDEPAAEEGSALTRREVEILSLAARGMTNVDIASRLFLTENTVKSHMRRIFAKLGVNSRLAAVYDAITHGVIDPPPGLARSADVAALAREWQGHAPVPLLTRLRQIGAGGA